MFLRILALITILGCVPLSAQENYNVLSIPENLKENANAVVRLDQADIEVASRKAMSYKTTRVVTVLNEYGMGQIQAYSVFSKNYEIQSIEAQIFNSQGVQVKKIKRKDFKEQSLSAGSSIVDDKMLYLDYTPVQYPFTVVFTCEIKTCNTAFLPQWLPVEAEHVSTEKSVINISCVAGLGFKYKEYNFGNMPVEKSDVAGKITYTAANIPALRSEDYSPSLKKTHPYVIFGLEKFHLEGVDGDAQSWASFGSWIYNSLLAGTDELSPETIAKAKALVGAETDDLKKARIIYKYVQSRTRYVNISLGIGGWKPMPAKDVDRLGYGDCKGLSNYTRALLKAVGVEAYYTIVYAGNDRRSMTEDFVSMQGNHIILAMPYKNELVWMECTSQKIPFGFQGDFTDNRLVLMVKPSGGELVRTHIYEPLENSQVSKAVYSVTDTGKLTGGINIVSRGLQYDDKFSLEGKSADDLDRVYKSRFGNINNLKLKNTAIQNNADIQEFVEDVAVEAESYASKSGDRLMFPVNAFNQSSVIPQRYRSRKLPLEISKGFYDADEFTINLPEGFVMEARPENVTVSDKFGEYKAEYIIVSPTQMIYKRSLQIKDGSYSSADYENYRLFREKIARNDNAKIVLLKKQ